MDFFKWDFIVDRFILASSTTGKVPKDNGTDCMYCIQLAWQLAGCILSTDFIGIVDHDIGATWQAIWHFNLGTPSSRGPSVMKVTPI